MIFDRGFVDKWLADLRRDDKGRPVPYINMWGVPEGGGIYLKHDPLVNHMAVHYRDRGSVPNFTLQSPQRQRACMIEGLCQVCERVLDWDDRCLILPNGAFNLVDLAGTPVPYTTEPWLCPYCFAIASTWCPELIRRRRGQEIRMITGLRPELCSTLLTFEWIPGKLEAITRANPPVSVIKLAIADPRALAELTPQVKP